jgi:SHS2 domain-containing protein
MTVTRRGHRALPHTADLIIEAWGDDLVTCAEEAAAGLLEVCVSGRPEEKATLVRVVSGRSEELLAAILDEIVFVIDTSELLPVGVRMTALSDEEVELRFGLAARQDVQLTGAAPKAVVMLAASDARRSVPARCSFIIDV